MTSREKQLNRSPEGLMEMLTHHVAYEIDMMRGTYICLTGPAHVWFSQVVVNAIIESFCIHARNLIEFFVKDAGRTDETAAARHFTKKSTTRFRAVLHLKNWWPSSTKSPTPHTAGPNVTMKRSALMSGSA